MSEYKNVKLKNIINTFNIESMINNIFLLQDLTQIVPKKLLIEFCEKNTLNIIIIP